MAEPSRSLRRSTHLIVTGGSVFTPLGKIYQRVCVFTGNEAALDNHIQHGLRKVYGSDAFLEVDDESSSSDLPWWAFGAPLKKLEDSVALNCLERHLRRRRNLAPVTNTTPLESPQQESMILVYETDPLIKTENQDVPLSKDAFKEYLEAWSEIVFIGHGIDTEAVDLTLKFNAKKIPAAAPETRVATGYEKLPISQPTPPPRVAGGLLNRHFLGNVPTQKVKVEDPVLDDEDNEVISLLTTEVIEGIEELDGDEEVIQGPSNIDGGDGGGGDGNDDAVFDRLHPRRSERIVILDSMPKKKEPVPPVEIKKRKKQPQRWLPAAVGKNNNDDEAGPSKRPRDDYREIQPSKPITPRPMPRKPVVVVCGDAKGLWDPQDPEFITVTHVGFGNGSLEAIAAAAELEKKNKKKKKDDLVVTCNCFEKVGGRGTYKKWKHSVRVPVDNDPEKSISIAQFALEIGIPFENKPRNAGGSSLRTRLDGNGNYVPRTLEEIEETKLLSIKETLIKAGYSAGMAEKRLNSRRTFRGGHRPGQVGSYDWNLLLPNGVWVRSRSGITRNPKKPDMNEDDVIFSDEEAEETGRAICQRAEHCVRVQGHSGRCSIHRDFARNRWNRKETRPSKKRQKNKEGNGGVSDNDDVGGRDVYYSWDEVVDRQRGARQERWLKRQGQWEDGDGDGDGEDHSEQNPSDDDDGGYSVSLGFSSSKEDDFCIEEEEKDKAQEEDCDEGVSKILQ